MQGQEQQAEVGFVGVGFALLIVDRTLVWWHVAVEAVERNVHLVAVVGPRHSDMEEAVFKADLVLNQESASVTLYPSFVLVG